MAQKHDRTTTTLPGFDEAVRLDMAGASAANPVIGPAALRVARGMATSMTARGERSLCVRTVPPALTWGGSYDPATMPRRITWIEPVYLDGFHWRLWRGRVVGRSRSYWIVKASHSPGCGAASGHIRGPKWVHESAVLHARPAKRRAHAIRAALAALGESA